MGSTKCSKRSATLSGTQDSTPVSGRFENPAKTAQAGRITSGTVIRGPDSCGGCALAAPLGSPKNTYQMVRVMYPHVQKAPMVPAISMSL